MAGAHLDSVVAGPGLNDNGSGVAAVLEVAEQLASRPLADGAALRVGFWSAEEIGLVGSRRYVRGLSAAERRRIRAYVNLDMVGSPGAKADVYAGDGEAGRRIEAALREGLPDGAGEERLGGASDHASFAARRDPGRRDLHRARRLLPPRLRPDRERGRRARSGRMRVPPRTRSWRWRRAEAAAGYGGGEAGGSDDSRPGTHPPLEPGATRRTTDGFRHSRSGGRAYCRKVSRPAGAEALRVRPAHQPAQRRRATSRPTATTGSAGARRPPRRARCRPSRRRSRACRGRARRRAPGRDSSRRGPRRSCRPRGRASRTPRPCRRSGSGGRSGRAARCRRPRPAGTSAAAARPRRARGRGASRRAPRRRAARARAGWCGRRRSASTGPWGGRRAARPPRTTRRARPSGTRSGPRGSRPRARGRSRPRAARRGRAPTASARRDRRARSARARRSPPAGRSGPRPRGSGRRAGGRSRARAWRAGCRRLSRRRRRRGCAGGRPR